MTYELFIIAVFLTLNACLYFDGSLFK